MESQLLTKNIENAISYQKEKLIESLSEEERKKFNDIRKKIKEMMK